MMLLGPIQCFFEIMQLLKCPHLIFYVFSVTDNLRLVKCNKNK